MVFFLAGSQGILLSIALILSNLRKPQNANIFLGLLLSVFSIELLNTWAMSFQYHNQTSAIPFWLLGSYWIIPAALIGFLQSHTSLNPAAHFAWHRYFIPAIIEMLTELVFFYLNKTSLKINLLSYTFWFLFSEILPIIFTILVLIYYGWKLLQLQSKQKNNHTLIISYKLWLFYLVFSIFTVFWILEGLLQMQIYHITSGFICVFLLFLGYIVYFQPNFFQHYSVIIPPKNEEPFQNYEEEKELNRLKILFEQQKIYRKSRLTLEEVAQELNLPVRYVSYLINTHQDMNFSSFVNAYRVKEVIEKLENSQDNHKTLLGIALDAGFNSKSSFNQIFKTFTGETPSQYLNKSKK
jgi:AraC-like DNA-binding protein